MILQGQYYYLSGSIVARQATIITIVPTLLASLSSL